MVTVFIFSLARLNEEMESKLKEAEAKWATEFDLLKNVEAETVSMLEQQRESLIEELEHVRDILYMFVSQIENLRGGEGVTLQY